MPLGFLGFAPRLYLSFGLTIGVFVATIIIHTFFPEPTGTRILFGGSTLGFLLGSALAFLSIRSLQIQLGGDLEKSLEVLKHGLRWGHAGRGAHPPGR